MAGRDDLDKLERSADDRYAGKYSDPYGGQYGSDDPGHYKKAYGSDVPKGGKTSSPTGDLSSAPEPADLAQKEKAPTDPHQVGRGYTPSTSKRQARKWLFTKRRTALGGGLLGTVVAIILFFTFTAGPFEFVHIAQLLQGFHFSTQQNQQDDRFMKQVRLFRFMSKGEIEKTRMGLIGNTLGNRFETKLNASGLVSTYSDRFGMFNGYALDTTSPESPFHGLSDKEAIAKAEGIYGVKPVKGSEITGISDKAKGSLLIDASKLGYKDTFKLNYGVLREAGYSKLSAAIGARLFCVRAGCTSFLHPLTKLINRGKAALDERLSARKTAVQRGSNAPEITDATGAPAQKDTPGDVNTGNTARQTVNEVNKEPKSNLADFTSSLHGRLLTGGAAALGVVCMVKTVNDNAGEIKQAQVIAPLIRMGTEIVAVGNQVMSGQDVDLSELAQYSKLLTGADSNGNVTSWNQAASIKAELGTASGGITADKTLTSIGAGTPFDGFLASANSKIPGGLGTVCNAPVQYGAGVLTLAFSFTGIGAAANALAQTVVQTLIQGKVMSLIANWLAGAAVNPEAAGADYGNMINYGVKLAANDQALASGGTVLPSGQLSRLQSLNNIASSQEFDRQNLSQKLFNPYDGRSAISKLIDASSTSVTQNVGRMGAALLNFGHVFGSLSQLFAPKVQAAATPYDYGFQTYGFSEQDMNNPAVVNPYENACYVVGCPDHTDPATGKPAPINGFLATTNRQDYIKKAYDCFGVTVAPDFSGNNWDVTSNGGDPNPYNQNQFPKDCLQPSGLDQTNWLRLRFFIMDTETMNAMGCYAGDSTDPNVTQACTDIGFGGGDSSPSPVATPVDTNFSIVKLSPPLSTPGGQITPKGITLHWWGSDSGGQGIQFLVNALRGNTSCGAGGCSVQIGITDDGKVYQMTNSLTDLTSHAIGGNQTTIGIEIEGGPADFGSAGVTKYPDKFNAVVATVKYLVSKYNIPLDGAVVCGDVSGIHPHKAYNDCPGALHKDDIDDAYFNAVMQKVRQ